VDSGIAAEVRLLVLPLHITQLHNAAYREGFKLFDTVALFTTAWQLLLEDTLPAVAHLQINVLYLSASPACYYLLTVS